MPPLTDGLQLLGAADNSGLLNSCVQHTAVCLLEEALSGFSLANQTLAYPTPFLRSLHLHVLAFSFDDCRSAFGVASAPRFVCSPLSPFFHIFVLFVSRLLYSVTCVVRIPIHFPIRPTVRCQHSLTSVPVFAHFFSLCPSQGGRVRGEQPNAGHSHDAPLDRNHGPLSIALLIKSPQNVPPFSTSFCQKQLSPQTVELPPCDAPVDGCLSEAPRRGFESRFGSSIYPFVSLQHLSAWVHKGIALPHLQCHRVALAILY
ncbi:hypothetical protein HDV63DRAFT_119390 [Trichoderma sp. SZMC 28014]